MPIEELTTEVAKLTGDQARTIAETAAKQLTTDELRDFRYYISVTLPDERKAAEAAAATKAAVVTELREQGVIDKPVDKADSPEGYTQWTKARDDMRLPMTGDKYYNNTRVWESLIDFNTTEPGLPQHWAAWRDVTDELFPPKDANAPVEYTDNHHWKAGDRVNFKDTIYVCTGDHYAAPGWNPGAAHAYWQKEEPDAVAADAEE